MISKIYVNIRKYNLHISRKIYTFARQKQKLSTKKTEKYYERFERHTHRAESVDRICR